MLGQLRVGTTWPGEKCNQPAGTTGLVAPVAWPWLSGAAEPAVANWMTRGKREGRGGQLDTAMLKGGWRQERGSAGWQ